MLEHKRTRLLAVAARTRLIQPRHRQPAACFENVAPMGIMALGAIDLFLDQRVVLRQPKLCFHGAMAFKTRRRIFAGIDDESAAPTSSRDMQASGPMAR